MPNDEPPPWWEHFGIDPDELTASVEAALVGRGVARECLKDAEQALLRTTAEHVVPLMRGMPQDRQIDLAIMVAACYRRVCDEWESELKGLRET
jgi:hypothetical protein